MAGSMRDIKNRIVGTKKTSQITKAMNMVSAAKLKKSERNIKEYRPFMKKISDIVSSITNSNSFDVEHSMLVKRDVKVKGYIVLSSDRGLAGSFNSSILKKLLANIKSDPNCEHKILAIGQKAYSFCRTNKLDLINEELIKLNDDFIFNEVIDPLRIIVNKYLTGEIDQLEVYYNKFVNTITQESTSKVILPIKLDSNENISYDYDQDPQELLNTILPTYVENTLYGFIIESKTSEHASRMTAMNNATDNANNVITELELIYNRARQSAITLELTDIVGGANAVK